MPCTLISNDKFMSIVYADINHTPVQYRPSVMGKMIPPFFLSAKRLNWKSVNCETYRADDGMFFLELLQRVSPDCQH